VTNFVVVSPCLPWLPEKSSFPLPTQRHYPLGIPPAVENRPQGFGALRKIGRVVRLFGELTDGTPIVGEDVVRIIKNR
jgi:hypothetical protein